MEVTPLSQLFFYTHRDDPEPTFCALNWLLELEDDVLDRLIEVSEDFFKDQADETNLTEDTLDYVTLCYMIAKKESDENDPQIDQNIKANSLMGVALFAVYEKMRRKGLLEFVGTGRVSEFEKNTTQIELTEIGSRIGDSIKTLSDLQDMMERS